MKGPTLKHEKLLWQRGYRHVAGVDEAGRGCLAGPVVAAAVIFEERTRRIKGVTDSKLLSPDEREQLAQEIEREALGIGVGICSPREIDELNVLWASMEAMRRAVRELSPPAEYLLIDGDRCFPNSEWPFETIVKGDLHCHAIAAASIIAKVTRDRLMRRLHLHFPAYSWNTNVGYPTQEHFDAIAQHGPTPHHRQSFNLRC